MKSTRPLLILLCIFSLLFAQQAGAAHAVHHAFEDLTHQQEDKQTPHSDACEQCANYMQLGSALNVGAYEFTPPVESGEAIEHRTIAFRSIPVLAAAARGPPSFLQLFA
jgi:hypothetical protein